MDINRVPEVIWVYIDEYVPVTAELEIVTGEIIKGIKGNPLLHDYYFVRLAEWPSIQEKLEFARHFWSNLEKYRAWVDWLDKEL